MKKILKTLAVILIALIIILASLVVWQWENIKVLWIPINHSEETINMMVQENEEHINETLNELTDADIRDLSDNEKEKLLKGELSEEDAIKIIKNTDDKKHQSDNVDDIISRMYLLRAEYLNRLTSLENETKSKAKELLKQKVSISEKLAFIEKYTGKAVGLEKECDARMKVLVNQLETELKRLGKDTGIISDVREYYEVEKKLKKSQLLSKYSKYLK